MIKCVFISICLILLASCNASIKNVKTDSIAVNAKDTVTAVNDSLEYEVIIIDAGFNTWLTSSAKPRQYYTQNYMEMRNKFWIQEWNNRVLMRSNNNAQLYEMPIEYRSNIDYGYEVNYLLFNYLNYFQIRNQQQLGGFYARI